MERTKLAAETREIGKRAVLQQLRKVGRIPAILYGRGFDPLALSVNAKELTQVVRAGGINALIDLNLANDKKQEPLVVLIKEMQTEVVTHQILHLDLLKVDMKEKVTVTVPVRLIGKAVGVTKGGLIDQPRREVEVKCLPTNIPEFFEVDITPLDIGDNIHVKDLKLPKGVEVSQETNFTIISIVAPRKEEPAPEAAAAAAAPEGAPAAAEGAPAPAAEAPKKEEKEGATRATKEK